MNIGDLLQTLQDEVGEPDGDLPHWGFTSRHTTRLGSFDLTPRAMAIVLSWAADHPEKARTLALFLRTESES